MKEVTLDEKELDRWMLENRERIKEYDRKMRKERREHPLTFGL